MCKEEEEMTQMQTPFKKKNKSLWTFTLQAFWKQA